MTDKYVVVPVEATGEMIIKGGEEFFDCAKNWKRGSTFNDQEKALSVYHVMIGASPAEPLEREAIRNAALDKAINICESYRGTLKGKAAECIADRILELKSQPAQPTQSSTWITPDPNPNSNSTVYQEGWEDACEACERLNKKPAQPSDSQPAWTLADKVRADLDRQSCPDAFMRIAVESIVKHFKVQPSDSQAEPSDTLSLILKEFPYFEESGL